MSMSRLAVLSAVHTASILSNGSSKTNSSNKDGYGDNMYTGRGRSGHFENNLHGNVNVLLGGAMLGVIIVFIFSLCYCCHKSSRKNRPQEYSQYWRTETDVPSLEVFTMNSHVMCYERDAATMNQLEEANLAELTVSHPQLVTSGPPPAYESLIFKSNIVSPSDKRADGELGLSTISCSLPPTVDFERNQQEVLKIEENQCHEDEGLPSYEAALKLEAQGYV
ncbi:hypothetical protein QAD02_022488 [Eretmocerus hayati]|uniref:Uncharacterized protein n=1 Tax=Eretmocerus hayati TaxID=131215 RepID=A0ACC2PSY4_9HYME|nr:hypothetical protein QAD02_022488 [Eretmocerus hayati]